MFTMVQLIQYVLSASKHKLTITFLQNLFHFFRRYQKVPGDRMPINLDIYEFVYSLALSTYSTYITEYNY